MILTKGSTPTPRNTNTVSTSNYTTATQSYVNQSKANANIPMVDVAGEANYRPQPNAMTQTIVSNAGVGGTAITAYFMNEDVYNATPTNNGSGALSVSNSYGDGWTGGGYNRFGYLEAGQNGIACFGLTIVYTVIATSAQDASALPLANPTWRMANLVGNAQLPVGIVLAAGQRNTQFQAGTMTVRFRFNLGPMNQLSYSVPVGDTCSLTVMTSPFDM